MLVSTIASPKGSLTQHSIHHWAHNGPGRNSSFVMPTNLSPDSDMRLVSGFQELGSFAISAARSSAPERHAYLAALPRDIDGLAPGLMQRGVEADKMLFKSVVAALKAKDEERQQQATSPEGSEETAELRLYSMEIGTRAEDALAVANADAMVWNWAKPDSPYLTQGSWYATLDEAVVDGAWRAGRGFSISVEVVGEDGKISMFEPGSGR